jgi:hypothetical protein
MLFGSSRVANTGSQPPFSLANLVLFISKNKPRCTQIARIPTRIDADSAIRRSDPSPKTPENTKMRL